MSCCCEQIGRFVFDNATPEAVEANANIPLPIETVSTRCIDCDGSNITINRAGNYRIEANFAFVGTAVGNIEVQMYRNGNAVPGAHAFSTFAAVDDYVNQAITAIITVPSNVPQATINFKPDQAASVRVANVIVTKLA